MLFWGEIFCFGVSERPGVRLPMLLCDNSLKRAAGSLIGPDSDEGWDMANTQLATTAAYVEDTFLSFGGNFAFHVGLQLSL